MGARSNGGYANRIVRRVAEVEGVEPDELPPLYESIDPDALATLLESSAETMTVEFSYLDYRVIVDNDAVTVHETERDPVSASHG